MQELSLNILDIAQNSIKAGALLIEIEIQYESAADLLRITIRDNGCGMTAEQVAKATDPFFTTRTTRRVGMGLPLLKMAAEMSGGTMTIQSEKGRGTVVSATFGFSHIDRLPMGDLPQTMTALIGMNPSLDFVLRFCYDGHAFTADTREYRSVLGEEISLSAPEVQQFIQEQLREGIAESCPDPGLL